MFPTRQLFLGLVFLLTLLCFLSNVQNNASLPSSLSVSALRRALVQKIMQQDHIFVPASDSRFHYVGRWTSTPNRLRRESAFPGAYIDVVLHNASSVYLSLRNEKTAQPTSAVISTDGHKNDVEKRQVSFRNLNHETSPAAPVSLLTVLDGQSYVYFQRSAHGIICVATDLDPSKDHQVRVVHTAETEGDENIMQFDGLWLSKDAWLSHSSYTNQAVNTGNTPQVVKSQSLVRQGAGNHGDDVSLLYRRAIEVLSDDVSLHNQENSTAQDIAIVVASHWQSQVANLFDMDCVTVPTSGLCLTEQCNRASVSQAVIQDLFFRAGHPSTTAFQRLWPFQDYVPDALILNLGSRDFHAFLSISNSANDRSRGEGRTKATFESFSASFVKAYTSFITQIRRRAYPMHPAFLQEFNSGGKRHPHSSAPSTIPVFILRPFDGALEHATQAVVEQLQKEGDRNTFWVDTTGWLDSKDYVKGETGAGQFSPRLTPHGHKKVASFMHVQLCQYLVEDPENCPFLRRENYLGSVYVPQEDLLNKMIEESKMAKIRKMFWGENS